MSDYIFCPMCRTELAKSDHGGALRQSCPVAECGFVFWDNPILVTAAIVEHDQQVVLVRSHGWPEGAYGLVAGFLENGETPEQGILREIAEEIGISVTSSTYLGAYPFALRNQLIFVYHVEVPHLDVALCQDELAGYRVVPISELTPWTMGTGPALRDWLATHGYFPEPVVFGSHINDD